MSELRDGCEAMRESLDNDDDEEEEVEEKEEEDDEDDDEDEQEEADKKADEDDADADVAGVEIVYMVELEEVVDECEAATGPESDPSFAAAASGYEAMTATVGVAL